ncbi:hypothetical protein [Promicromonospora sp. NPDC050249]|uniref:hypothetical protein n=1 Tax=Promicromonospora sp. NPDC050249 TaxID=3154743 RepID=UPI0033F0B7FA
MLRQWCATLVLTLVAVLAVTACAYYDQDAPVRGEPAPDPEPTGALYSRVMHAGGDSAPRSSVSVYLYDTENDIKAVTATMSLGFFCVLPGPFCPRAVSAEPDERGLWSLPEDEVGDASAGLQATATLHVDDAVFGPSTVLTLPASDPASGTDGPRRVPDLVYWEPELAVTGNETGKEGLLQVSWPAATGVPAGKKVTYTVVSASTVEGTTAEPRPLSRPTSGTAARVDARVYADAPSELMVVAQTTTRIDGERVDAIYRSAGVPPPADLTPPSRGAECLAEDKASGRLVQAVSPCPITDGDVEWDTSGVRLPTDCVPEAAGASVGPPDDASSPEPSARCAAPERPRVCVVLPEPREVSLVVLRTPFSPSELTVELLDAERRAVRSGAVDGDAFEEVYPVRFQRPAEAGVVCVRDAYGSVSGLSEISVW